MNRTPYTALFLFCFGSLFSFADTFQHKHEDVVYTGYALHNINSERRTVMTEEKGAVDLNLSDYSVVWNALGRSPHVGLISIEDAISYDYEAAAIEKALIEEANKGPLFILIELDTPGGRVDLAKRICGAIIELDLCRTVAFVKGDKYGGAYSAGAAIAMACDQLYMGPGTSIGAATMMTETESGMVDMKEAYGQTLGEKFESAWRTYLASLAEANHRPGALAMAMADKNIVVVEVKRKGQSCFIEINQQTPDDEVVRTVSQKGHVLTMPAGEAVICEFANGTANSRGDVLEIVGHPGAGIVENNRLAEAKEEFEKVLRKFDKLNEELDLKFREVVAKVNHRSLTRSQAVRDFEKLMKNAEYLLKLKKAYPEIPVPEAVLTALFNSIKAEYLSIKAIR